MILWKSFIAEDIHTISIESLNKYTKCNKLINLVLATYTKIKRVRLMTRRNVQGSRRTKLV